MRNFIQAQHPRGGAGVFVDRIYTAPEISLDDDAAWPPERFDPHGGPEVVIDHGRGYRGEGERQRHIRHAAPVGAAGTIEAERTFQNYARFETAALLTPTSSAAAAAALHCRDDPADAILRLVTMTRLAEGMAPLEVAGPDPTWEKPLLVDVRSGQHNFVVVSGRVIVQIAPAVSAEVRVEAGACVVLLLSTGASATITVSDDATAIVHAPAGSTGRLVLGGCLATGTVTGDSTEFVLIASTARA